jgi:demethylmenaquinone methyltransferase/2-methoxy-6-polyprenyl-1,4-benzoquinol methylase
MFDRISRRYDLLNRLISFGMDLRWRRRAVDLLGDLHGKTVLDLCCGSADFVRIIGGRYRAGVLAIGGDFSRNMLVVAASRVPDASAGTILLCQTDATEIPLSDGSVDAVTIGFGIRNIPDKQKVFAEILRVLRPGGRLVMLEPSLPKSTLWRFLFLCYFNYAMSAVGGIVSGDFAAYKYLHDSVRRFPEPEAFRTMMAASGFVQVRSYSQAYGAAMIYYGEKGR